MDYNFENESQIRIPESAYRPYKRCEFCNSVYLTDNLCEACGRSVRYDLMGPRFGYKSFYGIKERYVKSLPTYVQLYPIFENITDLRAQGFIRQLKKRLGDIANLEDHPEKKYFNLEAIEIINELIFYNIPVESIRLCLFANVELDQYLSVASLSVLPKKNWNEEIGNYRVAGVLRVKFMVYTVLALVTCALLFFNWQFGK